MIKTEQKQNKDINISCPDAKSTLKNFHHSLIIHLDNTDYSDKTKDEIFTIVMGLTNFINKKYFNDKNNPKT